MLLETVFRSISREFSSMAQYKGASREGHRAQTLLKRRERQKEEMELLKNKLQEASIQWTQRLR